MGIFRRKKKRDEEEYEDEELDEESSYAKASEDRGKAARRKRKKPTDEPREKKPPKPWGRKERLWVLGLLLFTTGLSGILALSARSWKLPGLPRIGLPTIPAFSFLSDETIVIEGNKENVANSEIIVDGFHQLTDDLTGVYGVYVINLSDGYAFGVNEEEVFEPASLNKLPVIMAAYRQSEKGRFDLDDEYVLKDSDKIQGSGSLSGRSAGAVFTYRELIRYMGKESDNTAYGIVRDALGAEIITQTINEVGMTDTDPEENETTPKDIGLYLERLYKGALISTEAREEIFDILTDTLYEDHVPVGIPDDNVEIAHKYGREVHVINDAGIVFADVPYVIVVMSKGIVDAEGNAVIPQISQLVYEVMTN